jgi:GT2 family glycosyltransferase/glycosyltransferase involved in cell wall biosynthesis
MNNNVSALKAVPKSGLNQSTLHGRVKKLDKKNIVGWVQYSDEKGKAVEIDVYDGDTLLETIQANQNTEIINTLDNVGFCGFVFPVPKKYLVGGKHSLRFVDHNNQQALPGSPFKLGDGVFDSEFHIDKGEVLIGSIRQRTKGKAKYSINLFVDKKVFWTRQFKGGKLHKINAKLPENVFDGYSHSVQIKVCNEQDKTIFMTARKVKHSYRGLIESVSFEKIEGWIIDQEYPGSSVNIDLMVNGQKTISSQCEISRPDVQKKIGLDSAQVGFNIALPNSLQHNTSTNLEVFIKGTESRVLDTQYILTPKDIIIRSLISASEHLNSLEQNDKKTNLSAGLNADVTANTLVRQQILAPIIKQLRQQPGIASRINLAIKPITQMPAFDKSLMVDIIVPVYKGYDETIACIESVLSAKNNTPSQFIVINDQSPDGRLSFKLKAMAKDKRFTLIENPKNLGFVSTANIGLGLHTDRDVVLLNADTEVYDGWLDRMVAISKQDNNIATVTPFSNNATICSFPEFNQDNQITPETSPEQLDKLFATLNHNKSVDLPTAHGFCMLIKREVLQSIGYLDEKTWQKGYGEENDFCLRAAILGWRHVLATNVFVQHHGSVSFADSKNEWLETNLAKLNQKYPDYPATVQRFIQQDPIAEYRNPVIKKLILQQSEKHVLFIMHNLGGGAKTNADRMAELLVQQGHAVLELISISETQWELKDQSGTLCLKYNYPEDQIRLENDLKEMGVWRIHFHQLVGFPKQIWQLPEALSCTYDFTAHDFLPLCPRINMIDESGQYCGDSQYDNNKCQRCVELNGLPEINYFDKLWQQYDQSIEQWREDFKQNLSKAENIFCPSSSTAKIYKKHYSLKNIKVKTHPEEAFTIQKPIAKTEDGLVNVALIGAIGDHKGSRLLLDCAKHALKEGLPIRFKLIGYSNIDDALSKLDNVTVTGAYKDSDHLTQLIKDHQCQIALFLSVWPETFCYTLTEALQNNLYPVALNYGAIAERIKKLKHGLTLSTKLQPKEINKKLIDAADKLSSIKKKIEYQGSQYPDIMNDYYHAGVKTG